jgi:hypothetical protein
METVKALGPRSKTPDRGAFFKSFQGKSGIPLGTSQSSAEIHFFSFRVTIFETQGEI